MDNIHDRRDDAARAAQQDGEELLNGAEPSVQGDAEQVQEFVEVAEESAVGAEGIEETADLAGSETMIIEPAAEDDGEELSRVIEELCLSKAEEFALLGYEGVSGKDIWEFVSEQYKEGIPPIHRLINDILSLRVNQYMNWLTLSAYKGIKFHE